MILITSLADAYYIAFPKDRLLAKVVVYTIFVLEIVQTGIVSHDIFFSLGSAFNDANAVDAIRTNWWSIPVSGGTCTHFPFLTTQGALTDKYSLAGFIGQLFFSYRIWMMSEKRVRGAPLIIGVVSIETNFKLHMTALTSFDAPIQLALASWISALICAEAFFRAKYFSVLLGGDSSFASIAVRLI